MILLIDTYGTVRAVHEVVALHREGVPVGAVRLDSGDLDELEIERLLAAGAPIDAFGVTPKLDVSPGLRELAERVDREFP